jgi:hypothetical protein
VSVLGQSLRETEDQLARSMMEGGAPPVNCTSGTNGRVAVLKPSLIEVELCFYVTDNTAQAVMAA